MADFSINQGDSYPTIRETLTADHRPLDLTAADSIEFVARRADGVEFTVECLRVPGVLGGVVAELAPTDTTQPGVYRCWFRITWEPASIEPAVPARVQHVPSHRTMTLEIVSA